MKGKPPDIAELFSLLPLFKKIAEEVLPALFELDYSPESLQKMEDAIEELYPNPQTKGVPLCTVFGVYFGEVLIVNFKGAKWGIGQGDAGIFDLRVEISLPKVETLVHIYPFVRISKFFSDRTDSITSVYEMVNLHYLGFMDISKEKQNKWVEKAGFRYRITEERVKPPK